MSDNAAEVAKTLMGYKQCPNCRGSGIIWRPWTDCGMEEILEKKVDKYGSRCLRCYGEKWVKND